MAGHPSARMVQAMRYILFANMTPYAAAKRAGIAVDTMYRSRLYKAWRDCRGDEKVLAEIKRELDVTRPLPRKPKKPQRFATKSSS
jgi:hypothetical protein